MRKIKKNLVDFFIDENSSIKKAIKKLNVSGRRTLIIVDKKFKLVGTVSDGDIRRNLQKLNILSQNILSIANKKPLYFSSLNYLTNKTKSKATRYHIDIIPVVDNNGVVEYIFFNGDNEKFTEYVYSNNSNKFSGFIMAGGLGTRLKPYTDVMPKSLLPYKGNSLIIHQINLFKKSKIKNIYISINYMRDLIKFALKAQKNINLKFIEEKKKLGTAGSLSLLPSHENKNIFIINSDVILKCDINSFMSFHAAEKNDVSIMVAETDLSIPYGQCIFKEDLSLEDIIEKPIIKSFYNVGAYIISKKAIKEIKKNQQIDMNILIKKLIDKKIYKIKVFKIDISDWDDYGDLKKMKNLIE